MPTLFDRSRQHRPIPPLPIVSLQAAHQKRNTWDRDGEGLPALVKNYQNAFTPQAWLHLAVFAQIDLLQEADATCLEHYVGCTFIDNQGT